MSRYQNFADTGGFSSEDLANIRARSVSPIRSAYSGAMRDVSRLGRNMPNYLASRAKMAREMSYGLADASTNAEANIAQMIQRGRLAGIEGMGSIYSATPGLTATYGGLHQGAIDRMLRTAALQRENRRKGITWGAIGRGALSGLRYFPIGGGAPVGGEGARSYDPIRDYYDTIEENAQFPAM
jgi:hypothetical protein